jgi:HTH-type transcriptional regulator/antitoxin HigA
MFGSLAHCGMLELFQPLRPIMRIDPVSVVRFLVEQQNLTQRDLIPQFGSESAVSMFMTGQRNLTLGQVRKLSARFKTSH